MASVLVFALSRASGDPRHLFLSEYTTAEQWEQWGRDYGLDKPYPVQYLTWLKGAVQLDFGKSVKEQISATTVVRRKIWPTVQLALGAYVFAILMGVPLGVLSATKRGTYLDLLARSFALVGQAMPGFWLGIMLILTFSVRWQILPASGREEPSSIILPAITLGWFAAAALLRLTRSAMLEVLDSEYVKLARAKGVSQNLIIWKHLRRTVPVSPADRSCCDRNRFRVARVGTIGNSIGVRHRLSGDERHRAARYRRISVYEPCRRHPLRNFGPADTAR